MNREFFTTFLKIYQIYSLNMYIAFYIDFAGLNVNTEWFQQIMYKMYRIATKFGYGLKLRMIILYIKNNHCILRRFCKVTSRFVKLLNESGILVDRIHGIYVPNTEFWLSYNVF